jgi:hypothetical protein
VFFQVSEFGKSLVRVSPLVAMPEHLPVLQRIVQGMATDGVVFL